MTVSTIMGRQLPSQDPREQQLPGGNELLTRGREGRSLIQLTHPSPIHKTLRLTEMVAGLLIDGWASFKFASWEQTIR